MSTRAFHRGGSRSRLVPGALPVLGPLRSLLLALGLSPAWLGPLSPRAAAEEAPRPSAPAAATVAGATLQQHCVRCHGETQKSGLDLRAPASVLAGGKRGPAIVPGKPEESLLYRFVLPGSDPHMPPGNRQLSTEEVAALKAWIEEATVESLQADHAPRSPQEAAPPSAPGPSTPASEAASLDPSAWAPPVGVSPTLAIDLLLEASWRARGIPSSPPIDDDAYARRAYLDLVGRIPTREERTRFDADRRSSKREALVDALLASPEHARRLCEVFDAAFLGRARDRDHAASERAGWTGYLEEAFRQNRPWNEVAREIIVARPTGERDRGAQWFLYSLKGDHNAMAESTASALFGERIGCAKCHNHPIARDILQEHYWGLVSFFKRTSSVETAAGPGVAESAIGGFERYTNIKGDAFDAMLTFLDGRTVPETRPAEGEKEADDPAKYLVPPPPEGQKAALASVPRFSRREKLAEAALEGGDRLSRAFVNRIWGLLLGRGIVHPLDAMDSAHPPSHPRLLEWLARDFRESGYDARRLVKAIVLSRAYALDSRPAEAGPAPPPESFARALDRPLTAECLARSIRVALELPPAEDDSLQVSLRSVFPDVLPDEPSSTLGQALYLTNNSEIERLLAPADGNLTARLLRIEDQAARVQEAFEAILGRPPLPQEAARCEGYLEARADRPEAGTRQLLWALLSSAEFFLNH